MRTLGTVASGFKAASGVTIQHFWSGATPTPTQNSYYTLGTWFTTTSPVTLHGIRIWNPGIGPPFTGNRLAWLWSMDNGSGANPVIQRTIDVPDTLPAGWSEWLYSTTVLTTANSWWCVGYYTYGGDKADYGDSPLSVPSTVGPITVTYCVYASGVAFPNLDGGTPFYGVDLLYSV